MNSKFFKPGISNRQLEEFGFRLGEKGTHSSRTIMFDDLTTLFSYTTEESSREDYARCIIDANCLGKETMATRRHSNQNLGELYGLDRSIPIFRIFRSLIGKTNDEKSKRLLAFECAIARDPLLAASAQSILSLPEKVEISRSGLRTNLKAAVGERLNEKILAKVIRNIASSWSQSGHLIGRTFKYRARVTPDPISVAFALCLAYQAGFRSQELFTSEWMKLLDCRPDTAQDLAIEAKRLGLIDVRSFGEITDLNFDRLDPFVQFKKG